MFYWPGGPKRHVFASSFASFAFLSERSEQAVQKLRNYKKNLNRQGRQDRQEKYYSPQSHRGHREKRFLVGLRPKKERAVLCDLCASNERQRVGGSKISTAKKAEPPRSPRKAGLGRAVGPKRLPWRCSLRSPFMGNIGIYPVDAGNARKLPDPHQGTNRFGSLRCEFGSSPRARF